MIALRTQPLLVLLSALLARITPRLALGTSILSPPDSSSFGFILIANAANLSRSFSPVIDGFVLSSVRRSPGVHSAILVAPPPFNHPSPAFLNGTAADLAAHKGTLQYDQSPPSILWGLRITEPRGSTAASPPLLHPVGMQYGAGTPGMDVDAATGAIHYYYGPSKEEGSFVACSQTESRGPDWPVGWVKDAERDVPDNCVLIRFLARCAELPSIPGDDESVEYNHDFANKVACSKE